MARNAKKSRFNKIFFDINPLFAPATMDRTASPRQRLDDFRAFLAAPEDAGTTTGAAEVWAQGKDGKGGIAGLAKRLDGSNARQAAREQVKQLLRDNHIAITADIRKALPSRMAPGNAASLSRLLDSPAVPLQVTNLQSLLPHLQGEIDKLVATATRGKPASLADFLLHDSGSVKQALVGLLKPGWQAQADDMAMQAFDVFARSLMFGKGIGEAMEHAFQDLATRGRALQPGKDVVDALAHLGRMLDVHVSDGATSKDSIAAFIADARQSLAPALMAGSFAPALVDALDARQKLFEMAVTDNCTVRGAEFTDAAPQLTPRKKVEIDAAQLWSLRPAALAARLATEIMAGSIRFQ